MRKPVTPNSQNQKKNTGPRMNDMINVPEVRLIIEDGENIGVVSINEATERAKKANLDLVEIVPNAEPPVCKIMNYSKFRYQEQKKLSDARKKQKTVELKEIKIRPTIEQHDYETKLKAIRRFLEAGNKVKVTLRFRGREITHADLGMQVMQRVIADTEDLSKIDQAPKIEGRVSMMILSAK